MMPRVTTPEACAREATRAINQEQWDRAAQVMDQWRHTLAHNMHREDEEQES